MTVLPRLRTTLTLLVVLALSGCATSGDDIRMVGVVFDPGADTIEITDEITGPGSVMYRFEGEPGEMLQVSLRPDDQRTEFVLYAPGRWPGEEMYDSRTGGSRDFRGELYRDGMHAIQVIQTGGAADEARTSRFDLVITKR